MRCLFFLLYEDYIDAQTQFAKELDRILERFARNLGDNGAVVRPFLGDIEKTKSHVLEKAWTDDERQELQKTPSLLMINVDFDKFDPRNHQWMIFNFRDRMTQGISTVYDLDGILTSLAEIITSNESDIFSAANEIKHDVQPIDAVRIFEAKPGVFGFSIDLIEAGRFLKQLYNRMTFRQRSG